MESVSVKQWPLLNLGSALSFSDTVPAAGGVISAFAITYKPSVMEAPCTPVDLF